MLSLFHIYKKNKVRQLSFNKAGYLVHAGQYVKNEKEHSIPGVAIVNIFIG
jgi:hypothetical protein